MWSSLAALALSITFVFQPLSSPLANGPAHAFAPGSTCGPTACAIRSNFRDLARDVVALNGRDVVALTANAPVGYKMSGGAGRASGSITDHLSFPSSAQSASSNPQRLAPRSLLDAPIASAASLDSLPAVCPPGYQLQNPADCPSVGPGQYAIEMVAAGLPYPFPPLALTPVYPYRGLTPVAYAHILTSTAPVFRNPYDALAGLPPLRRFETGYDFVSLMGQVTVDGQLFYQINRGEFMPAVDLHPVQPSSFQGRFLPDAPASPVGWVINTVQLSAAPGQPPAPGAPFAGRYQAFDVLGTQKVGDWNWYQIGPNQWLEQRTVALVQPTPPGAAGGTVIAVDTYEQSLGVYVDGRLIFATLVSSGSHYFPTRPGTFHVWAKLYSGRMSGSYMPDRRDYYFLQDVPWILYYDGDRALHGAYWHDNFGIRTSHGCVNLAPLDARWLFNFAQVGSTVVIFNSG